MGRTTVEPDDGMTTRERRNRPLLLVNTGDGKGKTSAAMGMALRSAPELPRPRVPNTDTKAVWWRRLPLTSTRV